jgi:sodium/proline symporter
MSRAEAILVTLLCYKIALVAIGVWASRRTRNDADFFLGGRRLGPWVAALSASASSSSAWTLLGVSGAAYAWGLSALWLFPATLSGFLINWLWIAPRLMKMSREGNSLTLTQFLASDSTGRHHLIIVRLSSIVILFSFMFYVAAQFQAAGNAFSSSFGLPANSSIAIGVAVIVLYTLLGGFWAVSVTDTLQGLLMVTAAVFLPLMVLVKVGGPVEFVQRLGSTLPPEAMSMTREYPGLLGLAFVLGTLGIGLGYPGQPHVVNRFMALRDPEALRRGRLIAIGWAVLIYAGMLLLGLCGRLLWTIDNREQIFFEAANQTLAPALAGIMTAAVLSAIMSTADSQLLVASSSISLDWRGTTPSESGQRHHGLSETRIVVLCVSAIAMLIAMFAPAAIFSRVLFAWHALGAAFGPALVLRLAGVRVHPGALIGSIATGFLLTVIFYLMPDAPGDAAERLIPLVLATGVALAGRRRKADADG